MNYRDWLDEVVDYSGMNTEDWLDEVIGDEHWPDESDPIAAIRAIGKAAAAAGKAYAAAFQPVIEVYAEAVKKTNHRTRDEYVLWPPPKAEPFKPISRPSRVDHRRHLSEQREREKMARFLKTRRTDRGNVKGCGFMWRRGRVNR